jgi:DNA-binding transcriptional LysR family regulator
MSVVSSWDFYRSFQAVMVHGSLSGAARALGLTQPTLGRHIEALERELGLPLFTRSPQGLMPTQAASDLLPHVAAMALSAQALIRQANVDAAEARGIVRLTVSEVMGGEVMPAILTEFSRLYPDIEIELVLSNQLDDLLRREADMAVRMVRPEQAALIAKRAGSLSVGFFAHRDYLSARGMPQKLEDLQGHHMVGYDRDPAMPAIFKRLGIPYDRSIIQLRTDSDLASLAAIRVGFGVGGFEWSLAQRSPELIPVLPQLVLAEFEVWVVMHEDLRAARRMRLLFDFLYDHLVKHVAIGAEARRRVIASQARD